MSMPSIASGLSVSPTLQAFAAQSVSAPQPAAAGKLPEVAQTPSMDELQQAVSDVQQVIQPVAQDLQFSIDKDSGRTIVKIVDSATDKVIRQIPSEELVAIAKALDKLQGLLVRQQA